MSDAGSRTRLTSGERRAVLLDAALRVFAARGYHAAGMEEIASAAGVSKALIYEHFDSKQALYKSLLERHLRELWARLADATDIDARGDLRLRAGVEAFLVYVEEHRDAWRVLFREAGDPETGRLVRAAQAEATRQVAAMLVPPGDRAEARERVEMVAALLTGAVQALATWWYERQEVPREHVVQAALDLVWLGLERVAAGEEYPLDGG